MTMTVTITNEGPEPYKLEVQVVQMLDNGAVNIQPAEILLAKGESTQVTMWKEKGLLLKEVS